LCAKLFIIARLISRPASQLYLSNGQRHALAIDVFTFPQIATGVAVAGDGSHIYGCSYRQVARYSSTLQRNSVDGANARGLCHRCYQRQQPAMITATKHILYGHADKRSADRFEAVIQSEPANST
jgi:hypothetical protein